MITSKGNVTDSLQGVKNVSHLKLQEGISRQKNSKGSRNVKQRSPFLQQGNTLTCWGLPLEIRGPVAETLVVVKVSIGPSPNDKFLILEQQFSKISHRGDSSTCF